MKRYILSIFLILFLCSVCFSFDKVHGSLDKFGFRDDDKLDLSNSIVFIYVFGVGMGIIQYDGKILTVQGYFSQEGSGVVVRSPGGELLILTNYHVINPDSVTIYTNPFTSVVTQNLKTLGIMITAGSAHSHYIMCKVAWFDALGDIAILKPIAPNIILKPIPYDIAIEGQFSKLEKGDAVSIVTSARRPGASFIPELGMYPERMWYYEIRHGKVINVMPTGLPDRTLLSLRPNHVQTDLVVYPGDSGSPVFVYHDGKPYLYGLVGAFLLREDSTGKLVLAYSFFVRLNTAIRYLYSSAP